MSHVINTAHSLSIAIEEYLDWLKNKALKVWVEKGLSIDGGAVERLANDGLPDSGIHRRVRVQARQMFVFAAAQHNGWIKNGFNLVARLDGFVNKYASQKKSYIYAHILDKKNNVVSANQDTYDTAFFLLAYGWRYYAFNDLNALGHANKLMEQIDIDLKGDLGGWMEGNYEACYRRQNPHMHLFEAFLCLYHFTNDGKWLAKAGEIFCLFETRFFDKKKGVLFEYFNQDWNSVDQGKGDIVEPGHMMEWVWLLRQYQKVTNAPVDNYCNQLYHNAIEIGLDPESNLLYDEVSSSGKIVTATKRCWPITEWIKASLAQADWGMSTNNNRYNYESDALTAITGLMSFYVSDQLGCPYVDKVDEENRVMETGSPASTLYHLVMAGLEAQRFYKSGSNIF